MGTVNSSEKVKLSINNIQMHNEEISDVPNAFSFVLNSLTPEDKKETISTAKVSYATVFS